MGASMVICFVDVLSILTQALLVSQVLIIGVGAVVASVKTATPLFETRIIRVLSLVVMSRSTF